MKQRLAVLVSGRGTNLQALIDACSTAEYPAEVALVVSNVPGVLALERAAKAQIPAQVLEPRLFVNRNAYDQHLAALFEGHRIDWVCLAGFMRLLGPAVLTRYPRRVLNIHPALLPSFPGLHAQRQALAHGVKVSGCTVHFVDEGVDTGPIVAQACVAVVDDDTEEKLAERIQIEEHRLYPATVRRLLTEPWRIEARRVLFE